jgi:hypothetical protein
MPRRAKVDVEAIKADERVVSVRLTCGHETKCQLRYARWLAGKGVCEECRAKASKAELGT